MVAYGICNHHHDLYNVRMKYTINEIEYDVAYIDNDLVLQSPKHDLMLLRAKDELLTEALNIINTHPFDFLSSVYDYINQHINDESNLRSYINQNIDNAHIVVHL